MEREKKLAIVAEGGSMTCSYSVGSLLALKEKYNLTNPDIAIAASGSAGTMAYFVSGQYDSIRNIWENLLSTENFIDPKRLWKIMDIDYLIDQVFKRQDPLLTEKVYSSPINFLIPFINRATGKVKFFSNRRPEDVFEALRAAKAMPFIYGKVVNIENEYYCDSLLSASPTLLTEKAKDLGAEKILVLDNGKPNSVMKKGSDLWVSLGNPQFKRNYAAELRRLNGLHFDIPIFYLRPSENLQISALSHDHARLKQTVDMGYEDTIRNKDLKSFLEM